MEAPRTLERRERALVRLAADGAVLAPDREGRGHGVFPRGDRRRRPTARLKPEDVHALAAEGALAPSGIADCWLLSGPGRARVRRRREASASFPVQHAPRVSRAVIEPGGRIRTVTAVEGPVDRLARVADSAGVAFYLGREIAAARLLWLDHARGQQGLLRGSDLAAPPRGSTARGPGGGQESATLESIGARNRVRAALAALPRPLGAAVRAFLLEETALEALERQRRWPPRSGKLVLKIALDLLADHYGLA